MRAIGLLFAATATLFASSAEARGTHFFAEVGAGWAAPVASDLDGGLLLQTGLGAGGKWRGFPPRFYALAGARFAWFEGSALQAPTGRTASAEVSDTEVFGGLRVVLPAGSVLRVYLESDVGAAHRSERLDRGPDDPALASADWSPYFGLAGALMARYHERASVGVRVSYTWALLDSVRLTRAAGLLLEDEGERAAIALTHTWHF